MNVLHKLTLQSLKNNRARTAVTVAGVMLSAALVTAVLTFGVSLLAYMARGAVMKYGDWHAAFLGADQAFARQQAEDGRVEKLAAFENVGYARLEGGKNEQKPYLFIAGYSPEAFETLPVTLFSGRLPENDGEALATGKIAAETGVKLAVGDQVTLAVGDRRLNGRLLTQSDPYDASETFTPRVEKTYRIVGVCQRPRYEDSSAPGYTLITRAGDDAGLNVTAPPTAQAESGAGLNVAAAPTAQAGGDAGLNGAAAPTAQAESGAGLNAAAAPTAQAESGAGLNAAAAPTAQAGRENDAGLNVPAPPTAQAGRENGAGLNAAAPLTAEAESGAALGGEAPSSAMLTLFVTLKNPRQAGEYAAQAAHGRAYVLNDYVLRFLGASNNDLFNTLLVAVGGVVVAIIMIGSVFLIYNSFHISLNERTRQFGVLMSVGATARQLRNSVLFEGLCIGAAGIPLGMLAGLGSIWLVIGAVARNFGNVLYSNVPLTVTVSLPALLGAAAVSLVTILISASLPARKAASAPVMECIRQTGDVKLESKDVRTSRLTRRLWGTEGMLALKNFKRNKKRYRSVVLSLVLSVVLFVSASAFVADMQGLAGQNTEGTTYDVAFSARDISDDELRALYEKMKNAPGVTSGGYQATALCAATVGTEALTEAYRRFTGLAGTGEKVTLPVRVQFLDEATYQTILGGLGTEVAEAPESGEAFRLIAVAQFEDGDAYADLFAAPSVQLSLAAKNAPEGGPGTAVTLTLAHIVPPDILPALEGGGEPSPVFFHMLAPYGLQGRLAAGAPLETKGMTFCSDTPAQTTAALETIAEGASVTAAYGLYNLNGLMDESRNYVFITNVFAYTFIVMISLIAAANVFNTISTNLRLRRRELAMLRSVGMARRDFQKMMNFECAFYGLRALAWGLPLAVLASWLVYRGMFAGGAEGLAYAPPWASLGIAALGVLLIVFVTMLYAVGKLKKENIIDTLRDEME